MVLVLIEQQRSRMGDLVTDGLQQQFTAHVARQQERPKHPPIPAPGRPRHGENIETIHEFNAGKRRQSVAIDDIVDALVLVTEGLHEARLGAGPGRWHSVVDRVRVLNRFRVGGRRKALCAVSDLARVRLRFGLAAWSNAHFEHTLYPLRTLHAEHLPRYATKFDCVEADVLHHKAVEEGTLEDWVAQTPEGFRFLPKLHKDATHGPTMRGAGPVGKRYAWLHPTLPEQPKAHEQQADLDAAKTKDFLAMLEPLRRGKRLGPILVQFAPTLERTDGWERLLAILGPAPPGTFAVEFRHTSWFVPAVENILEDFEAALVWGTYPKAFAPPWRTSDYGYVRFTGKHVHTRGRHVTVADRLPEVLEMRKRLSQADWKECFVIVTNPFEGNAVDSLPRLVAALDGPTAAKKFAREPASPMFPDRSHAP